MKYTFCKLANITRLPRQLPPGLGRLTVKLAWHAGKGLIWVRENWNKQNSTNEESMQKREHFGLLPVLILLIVSCNAPEQGPKRADSVNKESQPAANQEGATPKGDNIVKSEAPDAGTRSDQGYAMDKHDEGMVQSPINILTKDVEKESGGKLSITFQGNIVATEHLGHTIQVDFNAGSTETVNGKTFTTRQLHFHTPSEHLIDGITYPMEMHIVSTIQDSAGGKDPSYLVIAILFKMGKENAFIREFQEDIPAEEGKKEIQSGSVNMKDLFSQISRVPSPACYTYKGSLTTPPFTERVDWIVLGQPLEASPEQILAIQKREGNNARHIHALYERKIKARYSGIEIKTVGR